MLKSERIQQDCTIPGENPLTIYRFAEKPDVLLTLGQVGSPACGGNLDLFNGDTWTASIK